MHNDDNTAARPEGTTRVALLDEFSKTNTQKISVDVSEAQVRVPKDKLKSLGRRARRPTCTTSPTTIRPSSTSPG